MTSPGTTQFHDGLPQDNFSQDYLPPPNNQLQNVAPHDDVLAPVADYPTKTNPTTYQDKPLENIFSDFVPFNPIANLKEPWEAESERDDAFIQGVSSFLWCIYMVSNQRPYSFSAICRVCRVSH